MLTVIFSIVSCLLLIISFLVILSIKRMLCDALPLIKLLEHIDIQVKVFTATISLLISSQNEDPVFKQDVENALKSLNNQINEVISRTCSSISRGGRDGN